jgi:hypothetical protein
MVLRGVPNSKENIMQKTIVYNNGTSEIVEDVPQCGDYCDGCGDCLHCYWEDECVCGGSHSWVVYRDVPETLTKV